MATILEHLVKEHGKIKALFDGYESDPEGTYPELKELLELHTKEEEEILYPAAEPFLPEETQHAKEEHDEADALLADLGEDVHNMDKFQELRDALYHHIEEEETEFFPHIEEHLEHDELVMMDDEADEMVEE